jgi:alpha-glucosidase (family GH31 glycosyl hydrolase)
MAANRGHDQVVPVLSPALSNDSLARVTFWLPPGLWIDELTGAVVNGPVTVQNAAYDLSEVPRFVRAGAVIPKVRAPRLSALSFSFFVAKQPA